MFGFNINFGGSFDEMFDTFDCIFYVEVDGESRTQKMQAPRIMIEQQFMQLMQDAAGDKRPVRVTLSRDVDCFDKWTSEKFVRECSIEFKNRRYIDCECDM